MKTEYLDELYPHQLKKELSQLGVELTEEQYRTLLYRGRTFLYSQRDKRSKGKIIYRVTYPLYLIWNLLLTFVVQPVKWVMTGNFYFDMNNPVYKFTVKWGRKIGF